MSEYKGIYVQRHNETLAQLRQWKGEAMQLLNPILKKGEEIGGRLGESLTTRVLNRLDFLERENTWLHSQVERNSWIPVSESLPDFGQRVLLYHYPRYPSMQGAVIGINYRREYEHLKGLENERLSISLGFSLCEPIAWMPLPEPPKQ